jgi:hypothetical protein
MSLTIKMLGASRMPLSGVTALAEGIPLGKSHAMIKGILEALNVT